MAASRFGSSRSQSWVAGLRPPPMTLYGQTPAYVSAYGPSLATTRFVQPGRHFRRDVHEASPPHGELGSTLPRHTPNPIGTQPSRRQWARKITSSPSSR